MKNEEKQINKIDQKKKRIRFGPWGTPGRPWTGSEMSWKDLFMLHALKLVQHREMFQDSIILKKKKKKPVTKR